MSKNKSGSFDFGDSFGRDQDDHDDEMELRESALAGLCDLCGRLVGNMIKHLKAAHPLIYSEMLGILEE
jgi:hypothetical protein